MIEKINHKKREGGGIYDKSFPFDDQKYVYSLRNPVGFYQRTMVAKGLIDILNRNNIKLSKCDNILDLGCGIGCLLRIIAEIRGYTEGLTGIDLSKERIESARGLNSNIKYITGDICKLPFKGNHFDFVTAFVSFMFLTEEKDLGKAVSELSRILKPDGFFLFYDILGNKKLSKTTRGFTIKEVTNLLGNKNFKLIDKQTCFHNIFGRKRFSTAYLASKIPIEFLHLLEKFPISKPNNIFLLFQKV